MPRRIFAALCLSAAVVAPAAAQRRPAARPVAIITTGSEQAIKVGDIVLSRPFGAALVDRLTVVGTTPGKATSYHLIRGEAAGDCPARYVVVTAPRKGAPTISPPFGTCSPAATARLERSGFVVAMPAAVAGGPIVRFRYQGGQMRPLDPAVASGAITAASYTSVGCETPTSSDAAAQADVVAAFDRDYPAAYRKASALKRVDIAPDELRATVTELACVARWPGAETVVPQAATPLFASKRYGPAAFALVDTIAKDPASDANLRAAVRALGAEMLYRVDRREPL